MMDCLSHKHEDRSSDPQNPHTKLGTVMHICNPKTWEAKGE